MDRADFFASIRTSLSPLSAEQVSGIEAILDAASALPISHVAYLLATAWHETGMKMQPVAENLNYSAAALTEKFSRARISAAQAAAYGRTATHAADQRAIANTIYGGEWGRKNLGNTLPSDGWNYRGRALAQITGRTNYARATRKLGVDLLNNPDKALDPSISAQILVAGCTEGWFTGKRLDEYLPGGYVGARAVVNGNDQAAKIAGYARKFEAALRAGGYAPTPKVTAAKGNWFTALVTALLGGRK